MPIGRLMCDTSWSAAGYMPHGQQAPATCLLVSFCVMPLSQLQATCLMVINRCYMPIGQLMRYASWSAAGYMPHGQQAAATCLLVSLCVMPLSQLQATRLMVSKLLLHAYWAAYV